MSLTKKLRALVSKKKQRFQNEEFDLDLTYVTNNIIAMGWPSQGGEALYRNPMSAITDMLNKYHKNHFKVYNLCEERTYDHSKFGSFVEVFPFPDHNPPPLMLMKPFCQNVESWLKADPNNVAVVHCKAGKGRTGTMIAAYLLHDGTFRNAEKSLEYFGTKRTRDGKGVTINSQKRYVRYYEICLKKGFPKLDAALYITGIKFSAIPSITNNGCTPHVTISNLRQDTVITDKKGLVFYKQTPQAQSIIFDLLCVKTKGDVKITVADMTKKKEKMFHFWFNTNMVDGNKLLLTKFELDGKPAKDNQHKTYPEDFYVEVIFCADQKLQSGSSFNNVLAASDASVSTPQATTTTAPATTTTTTTTTTPTTTAPTTTTPTPTTPTATTTTQVDYNSLYTHYKNHYTKVSQSGEQPLTPEQIEYYAQYYAATEYQKLVQNSQVQQGTSEKKEEGDESDDDEEEEGGEVINEAPALAAAALQDSL